LKLGVFQEHLLQLRSKDMNKVLSSRILNWNLNHLRA
jgi:hypothetical protein